MIECIYCGVIINGADGCWNCDRVIDGNAYELEANERDMYDDGDEDE